MYTESIKDINIIGKTIEKITGLHKYSEEISFTFTDGTVLVMKSPDTYSNVCVDDVCGDKYELLDCPLLRAEEVKHLNMPPKEINQASYTWTFYKFATKKGYVDIRWYGTSNGYYSEECSLNYYNLHDLA